MDMQVRVALIGFGGMGRIYAKMIHAGMIPELRLTGVCCRNASGQELLRKDFPDVCIYADIDDMATHEADFDAVIIVTPHTSHIPIGLQMAQLGKHILMDKPAGISAGEVEELVRYCEDHALTFSMIFHNRCLPAFAKAREMVRAGALGKLHRAVWVCNSWYRTPAYHRSAPWRSSWNGECGGLMINQNPHYLDMWNWFFGLPDKVYAALEFGRYNDFQVDDAADVQFFYDSGFHGTMISATGEAPGVNRLEIWGSKGRLTVEDGKTLIFDENEMTTEEFAANNREVFTELTHNAHQIPLEPAGIPYQHVMCRFAQTVLTGAQAVADGWDGLKEVQLANAVYVSGWEERRVTLPVEEARYLDGLRSRQRAEREED